MSFPVDPANLLSQLRQTLLRVYDTMLANSKNTSSLPEFSGSTGSFKEWKLTFISQCSLISRAYECELTNSPLTGQDILPFLPPWIIDPEYADENPELTATANQMVVEMVEKIKTDVQKKLFHMLISITKGDARALCLQKSISEEQKNPENL